MSYEDHRDLIIGILFDPIFDSSFYASQSMLTVKCEELLVSSEVDPGIRTESKWN